MHAYAHLTQSIYSYVGYLNEYYALLGMRVTDLIFGCQVCPLLNQNLDHLKVSLSASNVQCSPSILRPHILHFHTLTNTENNMRLKLTNAALLLTHYTHTVCMPIIRTYTYPLLAHVCPVIRQEEHHLMLSAIDSQVDRVRAIPAREIDVGSRINQSC